jgi:hypothetical protein
MQSNSKSNSANCFMALGPGISCKDNYKQFFIAENVSGLCSFYTKTTMQYVKISPLMIVNFETLAFMLLLAWRNEEETNKQKI